MTLQQAMHSGFFSDEGEDVYRIGQQRKGMRETRLYIFARITGGKVTVLTIGDKSTQKKDVRWCHQWAREFKSKSKRTEKQVVCSRREWDDGRMKNGKREGDYGGQDGGQDSA